MPPRQIEFAKLYLTNVVTGKRYIKRLVEEGIVDGWDDPRLLSIAALRRRGFTPESLKMFVELCGISKANSSVDYAMLEYCILLKAVAGYKICINQAYFIAREHTEILLRRLLHEVFTLDIEFS